MAVKRACTHPDCTEEGIFTIEDGEHLCMQHIHEQIPWLPNGRRRSHLARPPICGRMVAISGSPTSEKISAPAATRFGALCCPDFLPSGRQLQFTRIGQLLAPGAGNSIEGRAVRLSNHADDRMRPYTLSAARRRPSGVAVNLLADVEGPPAAMSMPCR